MMKRCQVCLKEFEPKNYWQKYCSSGCKQAMWAKNKFEKQENTYNFKFKDYEEPNLNNFSPTANSIYEVKISFFLPIVDRLYRKTKKQIEKGDLIYCDTYPDLDNIVKPLIDKFSGKIWQNDRQIVKLTLEKFYTTKKPYSEIKVRILN